METEQYGNNAMTSYQMLKWRNFLVLINISLIQTLCKCFGSEISCFNFKIPISFAGHSYVLSDIKIKVCVVKTPDKTDPTEYNQSMNMIK